MGYQGQIAVIPFGKGGLYTDSAQTNILPLKLIRANNCTLVNDCAEKDFGSRRWNETALPSGIVQFRDWWPNVDTQRVIAVGRDGKIYRFTNPYNYAELTPADDAPTALNPTGFVTMVAGGAEESGRDRKLFISTGYNPVQVLSGDATTRRDIATPAADWTEGNQPFAMIPHRGRMFAFGCRRDPHRVYSSSAIDHEDFTGTTFAVYPGEGERLVGGFVFRSRLFILKYPEGLYYLDDSDASIANWFFAKSTDTIGAASPHGFVTVFDDVGIANQYGTVSSLKTTTNFGDIESADVFNILKVQNFTRNELARGVSNDRQGIYYADKQQVFYSFRSNESLVNDRLCILTFKEPSQPEVTWSTKDQPNCLGLVKDANGVKRPLYGAEDGYLYQMDQADRWVGTAGETVRTGYRFDIQTAHMDFRVVDPLKAEQNKIFDHLECTYEASGDWDLNVDVYIDGKLSIQKKINMGSAATLGKFRLNETPLDGRVPRSTIIPLTGMGRRISIRAYNEGVGQNIRLLEFRVYYRLSGSQQKKS